MGYLVFLGVNISYHKLGSSGYDYKNDYGYWEIKYLGESDCNTRTIRIGDYGSGTTFYPEKKESLPCGFLNKSKLVLEGPFYSGSSEAKAFYKVYCENTIKFEKIYCVSE